MRESSFFNTLLVPVDFSESSEEALRRSINLVGGENPVIILLHVIDSSMLEFAEAHGIGPTDQIVERARSMAKTEMEEYKQKASGDIEIDTVISEGVPFIEILKKSKDFAVDAVVMSKIGVRGTVEKMLFGSTVEKVVRGSTTPVIVLPITLDQ